MKRLTYILLFAGVAVGFFFGVSSPASAHILKEDGAAAAVMHIEPDDNPVTGKNTTLVFDFSGSSLGFDLNDFETDVQVFRGDSLLVDKPLVTRKSQSGSVAVNFPDAGAYQLRITGKSLQEGSDAGIFILQYNIRVSGGSTGDPGQAQTVLFVGVASMLILALIARRAIESGGRYKKHVQLSNQKSKKGRS
jgi:hypothetical protein